MWSFETANMKSTNWQVSRVPQGLKDLALQFATAKGNGLRQYQKEVSFHFQLWKEKGFQTQKVPLQLGAAHMLECDKHCDAPSKSCQAHQFSPVFLPHSAKSQREYNPAKTRLNTWASHHHQMCSNSNCQQSFWSKSSYQVRSSGDLTEWDHHKVRKGLGRIRHSL